MSPRWLIIEKLVSELGDVCTARYDAQGLVDPEPPDVDQSVRAATRAVTAAVEDSVPDPADSTHHDAVVRTAWEAIAVAQDRVARLSEAVARARELRARAQGLQDQSFHLRHRYRRGSG
jgi:hypothetical protein